MNLPIIIDEGSIIHNEVLGKLDVGPFHSNGANSKVHLATNQDGDEFALKIHRPRQLREGYLDTSFSSEPLLSISQKGICSPISTQVITLAENRASLVIILPSLSKHQMLSEYLQGSNNSSIDSRISISTRIVESLLSLHSHGWLHGDISTRNIMVNPHDLDVQLIDFEWSLELDHSTPEGTEATGTPEMISPEVRLWGLPALTTDSEVWSIAKVLMLILSKNANEEFRRIDEIGVLEYASKVGTYTSLYQPTFFDSIDSDLIGLLTKATCADGNARPKLDEILSLLRSCKNNEHKQVEVHIQSPEEKVLKMVERDLAVSINLDDGRSIKVRNGRERGISISEGIELIFDITIMDSPKIRVISCGKFHEAPLCEGSIIQIEENTIIIESITLM